MLVHIDGIDWPPEESQGESKHQNELHCKERKGRIHGLNDQSSKVSELAEYS
jgi:hypothetical protein